MIIGPLAITSTGSPMTSLIIKVTLSIPLSIINLANLPFFTELKQLLTLFNSLIDAPFRTNSLEINNFSSSNKPGFGQVKRADPPPEINAIKSGENFLYF